MEMAGEKNLREILQTKQRAKPLEEQRPFLEKQQKKIAEDLKRWRGKLSGLRHSLKEASELNNEAVDKHLEGYIESGVNPEEMALRAAPVEFKDRHLRASIQRYERLVAQAEGALIYIKREFARLDREMLEARADTLTRQAVDAGLMLARRWIEAEDAFDSFVSILSELHGLDQAWGNRCHKLGTQHKGFFAEFAGILHLQPSVLQVSKIDDVVASARRLGSRDGSGNPFTRPDGKTRFIRKSTDLHRSEYMTGSPVAALEQENRQRALDEAATKIYQQAVNL